MKKQKNSKEKQQIKEIPGLPFGKNDLLEEIK